MKTTKIMISSLHIIPRLFLILRSLWFVICKTDMVPPTVELSDPAVHYRSQNEAWSLEGQTEAKNVFTSSSIRISVRLFARLWN